MSEGESEPNWRRKLEADAQAGREAAAELERLRGENAAASREAALLRAGIDPDDPRSRYFCEGYRGPLDQESLQAAAREAGALDGVQFSDQAAMQRIAVAHSGGRPSGGYVPDFEAELDAIPLVVNGEYNPQYPAAVLEATAKQAAREGRVFNVADAGHLRFTGGGGANDAATTPMQS